MKILIRYATVVLPDDVVRTNVLIEDFRIVSVDAAEHAQADEVIDARGFHLLPGVVDDQVHFREPGLTHKEDLFSATRACAKGGVTSFLEMPNTRPPTTSRVRLYEKLALAEKKCLVNYGFFMGATCDNIQELIQADRTPGIKIFIGSSTGDLLVDNQEALERIFAETTLPIAAHCEDETTIRANAARLGKPTSVHDHSRIRDHQAAWIATNRATELAKRYAHRFHVLHLSTAAELALVEDHRGIITAEVCHHHLWFDVNDYSRLGTRIQVNPSVKTAEDRAALWQALLDGRIQVVATDHAPHLLEEKSRPYPESPSGLPAVENSLALMLDQVNRGRCSLLQVARWMCDAPARVWDLIGKGRIAEGYDADLVLVDMNLERVIYDNEQWSKCKWSPWHGVSLQGWPVRTWVMGREVYHFGVCDESVRGSALQFDHSLGGYWATHDDTGSGK
jgi:dihydroorotase